MLPSYRYWLKQISGSLFFINAVNSVYCTMISPNIQAKPFIHILCLVFSLFRCWCLCLYCFSSVYFDVIGFLYCFCSCCTLIFKAVCFSLVNHKDCVHLFCSRGMNVTFMFIFLMQIHSSTHKYVSLADSECPEIGCLGFDSWPSHTKDIIKMVSGASLLSTYEFNCGQIPD